MQQVKVISTRILQALRLIKVQRYGKDDIQEPVECAPFGIDGNPYVDVPDKDKLVAVYSGTDVKGQAVLLGYFNKNRLAEIGELRLYSTDESGEQQIYVWLKNNGTIELGGTDDNLTRFTPVKNVIDELQDDIAQLKQAFASWIVVPNDGGAALKAISAAWAGTPLVQQIDPAKIDEIKTL